MEGGREYFYEYKIAKKENRGKSIILTYIIMTLPWLNRALLVFGVLKMGELICNATQQLAVISGDGAVGNAEQGDKKGDDLHIGYVLGYELDFMMM